MKNPILYTHINWPGFSSWHQRALHMEWEVRKCNYGDPHPRPPKDSIIFYTNSELEHAAKHQVRRRVAFLLETRFIAWWTYEFLEANIEDFDVVLTYDDELIRKYPDKCVFFPHGGCSIAREEFRIYQKTKLVSFCSSVRKTAPGHYARHEFYELYKDRERNWAKPFLSDVAVDCYGQLPHSYAKTMLDCLRDYRFQIVMENNISDTYFTEKLIDCLVAGTVPIYRGTRKLSRFFDPNGILHFDSIEELCRILQNLTPHSYEERLDAVRRNFAAARDFVLAEDWIYRNTDLFR
jgi:hypothetical protein